MKCVVFGASGQLGKELIRRSPAGMEIQAITRDDVDLIDTAKMSRFLESAQPAVIINASAYTAVDRAEIERDVAFKVNRDAPAVMASCAQTSGAYLLHVSTDFVFDGSKSSPYRPGDLPNPLNVYGASKLAGEQEVLNRIPSESAIVRTAWVYSATGRNFVNTMLRLFRERNVVSVVADQVGTPTSASSLAHCIWMLALQRSTGIHHWTDAGVASWYDFAVAIEEEARALGLVDAAVRIDAIATADYPTPAKRPAYSVLDRKSAEEAVGFRPPHWRENLRRILKEIAI